MRIEDCKKCLSTLYNIRNSNIISYKTITSIVYDTSRHVLEEVVKG